LKTRKVNTGERSKKFAPVYVPDLNGLVFKFDWLAKNSEPQQQQLP